MRHYPCFNNHLHYSWNLIHSLKSRCPHQKPNKTHEFHHQPAESPSPPLMRFDTMVQALGAPVRCAILGALSDGEPRMVKEIAKIIGQSPGLVSQHLAVLRGSPSLN